jgi:hypothetical protein
VHPAADAPSSPLQVRAFAACRLYSRYCWKRRADDQPFAKPGSIAACRGRDLMFSTAITMLSVQQHANATT